MWFLYSYNKFHRAKFLGFANEITGRVNKQYNKVEDYFTLKTENKRLNKLNDSLLNLLPLNFLLKDTSSKLVKDSLPYDTTGLLRQYLWRDAQVVYNTINQEKNYIQINRGARQGIKDNMAVISSNGSAVGVIVNVSPDFSVAMSLLHVQSKRSAYLKKSGSMGTVEWDGQNPLLLTLRNIPKSDTVANGDTVLTNIFSEFPPGLMIGTVAEVSKDKASSFYAIKIKPSANFFNLQQVHIIEKLFAGEQHQSLEEAKNKINNPKTTTAKR